MNKNNSFKYLLELDFNFENMVIKVFLPSKYSFYDRVNEKYGIDYNKLTNEGYKIPVLFTGNFKNCNITFCGSEFENIKVIIENKEVI